MDLHGVLARRVFVPLYERRWGVANPALDRELARSQFQDEEQIRDRQLQRLRELLGFAAERSPFYRRRFRDAGFEPGDLKDVADLAGLPLLTKDDIRGHGDQILSEGFDRDRLLRRRTGGSTGVPLHLYWDAGAHTFKSRLTRRHDAWAGHRPGVRRAALWGDTDKQYPWKVRVHKALCERTAFLDTLEMDEARLDDFVDRLRRFRPRALIGHAHSIYFFTEHLVRRGIGDIAFDGIISTAETLSDAERETVESVFGPVVFDRYGCEEVALIASECEAHDGLHVAAEGILVEVLDGDQTTPGRVVLTDLVNRGMPLIRYEVGDLATTRSGTCGCGRGLPRLGRVYGRTSDILFAPDGRRISGISILDTFMIHLEGVKQAQIVQDALDHVQVRVVPSDRYSDDTTAALRATIRQVFGDEMRSTVERVERIEPTPRGKYQFSICEIEDPSVIRS